MQALILAGGRGMRMRPLTHDLPVPMLFLPGGVLLDRILHHLADPRISRIAVVLQHGGDRIARHLAAAFPAVTTIPQMPPFSFVGSLASAATWIEEPTLVIHGNTLFPSGFRYFLDESSPHEAPHLLVPTDGSLRPTEAGAYLLPPEDFYRCAQAVGQDDTESLFHTLAVADRPFIPVPAKGRILPIRTIADYLRASHYLLANWHELSHPGNASAGYDAMYFNWIAPDAQVDSRSRLLFTAVGPGAQLRQCQFHNALVLPNTHIEEEQRRDSIFSLSAGALTRHMPMSAGFAG